ncbi:MAG: membrane protein insertase YidC, partial [Spirochaetales bacterium]|nr:membrane protein insertase YidC [Spirochaetales bacterium]
MDKKTILAIVLVVLVITISMMIQTNLFSQQAAEAQATTEAQSQETAAQTEQTTVVEEEKGTAILSSGTKNTSSEKFMFETDLYEVEFDPVGASISSLMLREHADADGERVDIVFKGENGHNAFLLYWGDDLSSPVLDTFSYVVEGQKVIFTNDYTDPNGHKFTVVKTFEFKDGEYLFAV